MQNVQSYDLVLIASTWRAAHFFKLDGFDFVFCTIPKNANRTIKRFLLDAVGIPHANISDSDLQEFCSDGIGIDRFSVEDRISLLTTLPILTIIRDPYERIASAFSDRVVRIEREEFNRSMFEQVHGSGAGADPGISFREFVGYLSTHPEDDQIDHHWRPQAAFFRGLDVEVIGEVRSLNKALAFLQEKYALPAEPPQDQPRLAASQWSGSLLTDVLSGDLRRQGIIPPAAALYTADLKNDIHKRYAKDFALFDRLRQQSSVQKMVR